MIEHPKDGSVSVDGLRMCYTDWGGSGPSIVLVHGLASTRRIWAPLAPLLTDTFRVVTMDQRGHGESDKPEAGYDFDSMVRDLDGFLTALGLERPHLAGHSWGANVALHHAAYYPGRVRSLYLIDGGTIEISAREDMTLERAREELAPPVFTGLTIDDLRNRARSWDWGMEITSDVERAMLANFEVLPDRTVRTRLSRENHFKIIEAMWSHKPSEMYGRIACPVVLMPTRRERAETELERRFAGMKTDSIAVAGSLLLDSSTVWLEDSVHDVPLQRPGLVAEIIKKHADGRGA